MDHSLPALLPPVERLALAYAPASARPAWLALLALDARLGQLLRQQREPLLTQIRLAWWRDRLGEPASAWPSGEPLLVALAAWQGQHGRLAALADGWEMLLGQAPLPAAAFAGFVGGRAEAMQALARLVAGNDAGSDAHRAGAGWAIADLAAHLSHEHERAAVRMLADSHDWHRPHLPRAMRPLVILQGLAARSIKKPGTNGSAGGLLVALRLGILGV